MQKLFVLIAMSGFLVAGSFAQNPAPVESGKSFMYMQKPPAQGWKVEKPEGAFGENFFFYTAELGGNGEVVKGAPYTATAVTETTQSLADGNRITNKTTASVARDSEGRTRREETLGKLGAMQVEGPKTIIITDPSGGSEYVVRSVHEMPEGGESERAKVVRIETNKRRVRVMAPGKEHYSPEESSEVKHESLGTQTIEGVSAEGKRETRTIPAGTIGNERPIEITSETWYSPDLHVVVLSKRNDPRFGQTTYRLTEIRRTEPDPALFQAPKGEKGKVEMVIKPGSIEHEE